MKLNIYITFLLITLISCNQIRLSDINQKSTSSKLDSLSKVFLVNPYNLLDSYYIKGKLGISFEFMPVNYVKKEDLSDILVFLNLEWYDSVFNNEGFKIVYNQKLKRKAIFYRNETSSKNWNAILTFVYYEKNWYLYEVDFYNNNPKNY